MPLGEKAKIGETLDRTFETMAGVPYKIHYCACCNLLFRKVEEEAPKEKA